MGKPSELVDPSSYNYGIWMRSAILKEETNSKMHALNAVTPATGIATDLATQHINVYSARHLDYQEACLVTIPLTDSYWRAIPTPSLLEATQ